MPALSVKELNGCVAGVTIADPKVTPELKLNG
jgi:hypothetical protein